MSNQKYAVYQPKNSSPLQEKFINCLMKGGKKTISRKVFEKMLEKITKTEKEKSPRDIFEVAVKNVMPSIEVRAKRVGGSVYQIPVEVPPKRQMALAIRWIITNCRKGKGRPMSDRLASEILLAYKNEGAAVKKRDDVYKMAQANKAYAHLARY
jgi:small subunit ribosomal protein S7